MTRDWPEEIGQMSNGKWKNPSYSTNDFGHDLEENIITIAKTKL